jgi:outer membrane protein OmpA-like peptidoglycan-associated protein
MSVQATVQSQTTVNPTFTPVTSGLLQRCTATAECSECRKKREGMLQRAAITSSSVNDVPPIVHEILRSPGQPLDATTRAFMEPRFGHDFSSVKLHTDTRAAESARAVNALAYTVGQNVIFGQGQYSPRTNSGLQLIAHELTHTVQQSQAGSSFLLGEMRVNQPDAVDEREAAAIAEKVVSANGSESLAANIGPVTPTIQRLGDLTKVPPGLELRCEIANDSPLPAAEILLFGNNVSTLSSMQEAQIDNFVVNWQASGANAPVRVDGYASTPGKDELNWGLSCTRAEMVVNELTTPTSGIPGIPSGFIRIVAQGETNEFGAEANNRRTTISSSITLPPIPSTTPPTGPKTECEPVYDASYGPSSTNCGIYDSPLTRTWLTWTYRHNATCACEDTPDNPKNNCVRKCLQVKLRSFLSGLSRGGAVIGTCIDPFGLLDPLCPEPFCRDIYDQHVDCFKECCCSAPFINYPTFWTMCESPFPCSFVGATIDWFNKCT